MNVCLLLFTTFLFEMGSLANLGIDCRGACPQPFQLPCFAGPFETQGQQAFIGPLVEPVAVLDPLPGVNGLLGLGLVDLLAFQFLGSMVFFPFVCDGSPT